MNTNNDCIFCEIIAGRAESSLIYEDELVVVFVDLFPVNEGHLLIVPKVHGTAMADVEAKTLGHMMQLAQRMNLALRKTGLPCEGVNLFLADGAAAGQEVFHCHLHVYPRYQGDGFGFRYDRARHFRQLQRPRMDEIAAVVKQELSTDPQ